MTYSTTLSLSTTSKTCSTVKASPTTPNLISSPRICEPFYDNSKVISYDETSHVSLGTVVGHVAVAECTYNSPSNDPASFAALTSIIEGVSFSKYCAAVLLRPSLPRLFSPNAESIISIEFCHSAISVPQSHFASHSPYLRLRDSCAGRLYYRSL